MRLRAFAAGWTVFTMLAAPALLLADETVPPVPPPAEAPTEEPVPPDEPVPPPAEVVQEAAEAPAQVQQAPAQANPAPAPAPAPAAEPAADPAPEEKAKPVARKAADTTVTIKDYDFSPASVTVNVGDTVTWVNQGPTDHTATGSGFDTGLLDKGESGSHTFNSAGKFSYICTPHPYMKASVTVVASDSGSDSGSGAGGQDDTSSGTAGTTTDTVDDGTSLPNSGADAWALALLGTGFLSLGVAVRRRSV